MSQTTHIQDSRRTAANRANAAHSTGPRTPQGKAASSKNATSHGLYAATVVVHAWESQAEFDLLRAEYMERFRPLDRAERDLVDRLVDSTWRRTRAISIETALYDLDIAAMAGDVVESYKESDDGLLRVTLAFRKHHGEGAWAAIERHISAAERGYQRASRELRQLQAERFNQQPAQEASATPAPEPEEDGISERSHFRPSMARPIRREMPAQFENVLEIDQENHENADLEHDRAA